MPDTVTPLCSYAQFTEGPLGNLVSEWSEDAVTDFLIEGTRQCEDEVDRRLAPFSGLVETHRAEGIDPSEYSAAANMPMSIQDTLSSSYAQSIGAQDLVRHCWLDQKACRYQDMWSYTVENILIIRSFGGSQDVTGQLLSGPEPDTGHLWFTLGLWLPVGTRIQVTYGGGYTIATPASLVRANKFMTAANIIAELEPGATAHDEDVLRNKSLFVLSNWDPES